MEWSHLSTIAGLSFLYPFSGYLPCVIANLLHCEPVRRIAPLHLLRKESIDEKFIVYNLANMESGYV